MGTPEQYVAVRNTVQFVLVPIIFVVGFIGNAVSILVLTRKRMRCSTNIYLTGLAIADIVYLTMLLIMSFEHYKSTEQIAIFWRCRSLFQWLIDSSSYISIYVVVCFTVERYIAVCHPMKGQVLCTESRAKKVLAVTVIIIMLSILSANFEFELIETIKYINSTTGEKCNQTQINCTAINCSFNMKNKTNIPFHPYSLSNETHTEYHTFATDCIQITTYKALPSELGNNETYRKIFDTFTIIFYSLLPLILIIVFNTFLILAVQKSNRLRDKMTNLSVRQIKHQQHENKITTVLIAVVILFIVCQTPWAIFLVLSNTIEMDVYTQKICGNIFNTLVSIDAASNFVLYCLLSAKYRKTLKELIMGYKYKNQNTLSSSRRDTLSSSWYTHQYKSIKKQSQADDNIQNQSSIKGRHEQLRQFQKPYKTKTTSNNDTQISSSFHHENMPKDKNFPLRSSVSFHHNLPLNRNLSKKQRKSSGGSTTSAPTTPDVTELKILSNTDNFKNKSKSESTGSEIGRNQKQIICNLFQSGGSSTSLTRSQSLIFQQKTKHSPDCPKFDVNF